MKTFKSTKNHFRSLVIALAAGLSAVVVNIHGAEPLNLRVVWTENPQTQAVVLWDSMGEGEGELLVREGSATQTHEASVSKYSPGKKGSETSPDARPLLTDCYRVELTGLKPSTHYFLTAKVGDDQSKEYYFITAPDQDIDVKIFFAGDSRTRLDAARAVSGIIRKAFEEDPSYLALVHAGDYTGKSTTREYTGWLHAYSLTTTSDGRLLPIIAVRGNHDNPGVHRMVYGLEKDNYNCMLSPHVSLLALDNNERKRRDQSPSKKCLEAELPKLEAQKIRYRIAAYHYPIYIAVKTKHQASNPSVFAPLFEKYNLDLGLEADGHCIKRTVPIRDNKQADDGVVYLGEGGYGAPPRSPKSDLWFLQEPGFAGKGDHYMSLSFTKSAIEYFTMTLDNGIVDRATFPAKNR
jgi:predicted phosphodiesterase